MQSYEPYEPEMQSIYDLADEHGVSPEAVDAAKRAISATPPLPIDLAMDGHPLKNATMRVAREFDSMAFLGPRQVIVEVQADKIRLAFVVDRYQLSEQLTKEL